MIDWLDAVIRLTAATVIGGAIGLDREAHGKSTGVRTLGIVALGSALIVLASQHQGEDANAGSRVIQGVITGIGFLGAGVILRNTGGKRVRGLTTAAAIWFTACIGVACGLGAWALVIASAGLVAILLAVGKPIERAFTPHGHGQVRDKGVDSQGEVEASHPEERREAARDAGDRPCS